MKNVYCILTLILGVSTYAQGVMHNTGRMVVNSNTPVYVADDFINSSTANATNDGLIFFYGNYQNEGVFDFTKTPSVVRTGKVHFRSVRDELQKIKGSSVSDFYNVEFDKRPVSTSPFSFGITNKIRVTNESNFVDGILDIEEEVISGVTHKGTFTFLQDAFHINTADEAHINGEVIKIGDKDFTYPIGKSQMYRPAGISRITDNTSEYLGEYFLENSDLIHSHLRKQSRIQIIDNKEYWTIKQSSTTRNSVLVTLSWDARTTPPELLSGNLNALRVVRWDPNQNLWIDEGGVVNISERTVTTPVEVGGFGIFTLARLRDIDFKDIGIYNGISANTDGSNDKLTVINGDGLQISIKIFNRWGVLVYEEENYDGANNFFDGISQGRVTIDKSKKLPQGTYYYILEYKDLEGNSNKKAGWLYLKTDY